MNLLEKIKKYPEETLVAFILLTGAVLRFHHLGFTSLSNDELSAITRAQYDSFSEMIRNGVMIDFHPAGVETFMYYWMKIFGDSVFIIRFPFAVAGILSIPMLYLVAKRWFNKSTALFASASLSFLQFPLLYSQLARPYSVGLLFVLAAAYCWTVLLFPTADEKGNRKKNSWMYAGFIISMSACTHIHYFALMLAGIIGLSGLLFVERSRLKNYLLSGLVILLLFIPEIPVFSHQMSIGGLSHWLPKPDETFFRTFIKYCFNDSNVIFFLCFGICIASFVYFRKTLELTRFHLLSLAWFLLPFFIGYFYSVLRNPVLQYSTLLFSFPFLLMFIFSFIPKNSISKKMVIASVIVLLLAGSWHTVKIKLYYWTNHFGVFKEIAEDAVKWTDTYGEDKMTKVISVIHPNYINFYFDKMGRKIKIDLYKTEAENEVAQLMKLVDESAATYFLYGWSNIGQPPEVVQIILSKFPAVVERNTYFNSGITLFKREPGGDTPKVVSPSTDFETNHWGDELTLRNEEKARSGKYSQKLDDKAEFSLSYSTPLRDLTSRGTKAVTASAWFNAGDAEKAKLVISFESKGKPFEWYATNLQSFNLEPGKWQRVILSRGVPEMKSNYDIMKVYIWNEGKKIIYVDDMEVKVE